MRRHRPNISTCLVVAALALLTLPGSAHARTYLDAINDADRTITGDLYNGQIVWAAPFGANGNTGSLWKVKIEHEGRTRWALFKPRSPGDRDGWARTPMEVAMYKLNRILGMDLIPPSAYRRNVNLNGQHFSEGALLSWVDDTHLAGPAPSSGPPDRRVHKPQPAHVGRAPDVAPVEERGAAHQLLEPIKVG